MQKKYTIFSKLYGGIKVLIYGILSYIIPKNDNIYIFGGNGGNTFSGNSKILFLYYLKKGKKCFYLSEDKININKKINSRLIQIGSLKYFYLYFRAKFIFIDGTLGDIGPLSLIIGKFNIINLWHGDPIKKIWFSNSLHFNKIPRLDRILLDDLYCKKFKASFTGNETSKKNLEDAFHSKHTVTGLARYDVFFNKEYRIENIKKKLNIESYKKVILYAPTWRDTKIKISPFSNSFFIEINKILKKDNYILLIKGHLNTQKVKSENLSNIKDISDIFFDIQELLYETDLLITDYSSIYIDFLLTNKPILFYGYDINEYLTNDREMYYEYEEIIIKENLIKTESELIKKLKNIKNIKGFNNFGSYKTIKNHFHKYQKGGYCEKIDKIIKELK